MKRPIAEVRSEIQDLDWGIQHGIVRGDGIAFREPELLSVEDAKVRMHRLKTEYPKWEKTPRTKR